jgi:hypothetical protein
MAGIPDNIKKNINNTYDKQMNSQLSQLRQATNKAIQGINSQKDQTSDQFYDKRNQADVVNFQSRQRLKEMMASSGLGRSGENISGQVGLQSSRQQTLGNLNNQEQSILGQYNQEIQSLRDPSREQSIIDAIEAQRSQALTQALERARQEALQREQMRAANARSAASNALARDKWEWQKQQAQQQASQGPEDANLNPIFDQLNRRFLREDKVGNQYITNENALFDSIVGLGLNDAQTDMLVSSYGLQGQLEKAQQATITDWWSNLTR